ncbi:MAG: hypothetical protein MUC41_14860 [Syntrophobacteraceae bacterium]|nr:hypothetical protein [Syntrophobacteraceae bacterium]
MRFRNARSWATMRSAERVFSRYSSSHVRASRGVQVQVVGGLVQEHEIRLGKEEPPQLEPHDPSAAQARDGLMKPLRPKAEPRENLARPSFEIVAAEQFQLLEEMGLQEHVILEARTPGGGLEPLFHGPELPAQGLHGLVDVGGVGQDRLAQDGSPLLGEVAHAQVPGSSDHARVRLHLSHKDVHQGGLPRPVGPDEPDAVPRVDVE